MPVFYPVSEFFESSGNVTAEFGEGVRDGVVDFACTLWSNFPAFITNNKLPVNSFARGYMNSVCQGRVPLPPLPPSTFTGGQCVGAPYQVQYRNQAYNIGSCVLVQDLIQTVNVTGPIGEPFFNPLQPGFSTSCNGLNNSPVNIGQWLLPTGGGNVQLAFNVFDDPSGVANPPLSSITEVVVTRTDGQPDDCGDPPAQYPPTPPTGNDLTTIIVLPVEDGTDLEFNLTYNQLSPEFNFPMGFKLNGVNVTLDFSGLTIHGDTSYNTFNTGNQPAPSGSDGGDNGVDPPYMEEYPDFNYPTLPVITNPEAKNELIEYLVCNEGVIELVEETLSLIPGFSPWVKLAIEILGLLTTDICEIPPPIAQVGYPEYYGVKPGANRPAIVYIYKEFDNGLYGASTYQATVNEPSQDAINEIETVNIPDKRIGTFVASISLLGGTRIRASGETNGDAISNCLFLLSKVEPAIVPNDPLDEIVVTEDGRLEVRDLVCRQIEYYPIGSGANKSPSIRRVIEQE